MRVTIYHNSRCCKSHETLALLQARAIELEIIEYLKTPPDVALIKQLLTLLGMKPRELLRSKEKEYPLAGLENPKLSDDQIIAAMAKYPVLIERPIVVCGNRAVIGRPPENVLEILT